MAENPPKNLKVANLGLLLESDPLDPKSCSIASKFNIKTKCMPYILVSRDKVWDYNLPS